MTGFVCIENPPLDKALTNTLSDNGVVTGDVSVVDENGLLSQVHETTGIEMREDGQIQCDNKEVQE